MNYLTRKLVADRLRFSRSQSYRLISCKSSLGLIKSDALLERLNRLRVNCPVLTCLPSDILTLDQLAERIAPLGIPRSRLARLARRKRNPLPHLRFNGHTLRFPFAAVNGWLEALAA